jgi:hypothetical protein
MIGASTLCRLSLADVRQRTRRYSFLVTMLGILYRQVTIAAFLVPSAALALGTISGSKKLFEVVYLMVWYVGSIDRLPALDLLGTTSEAITGTKFFALGLLSLIFLIAAITAREPRLSGA